MTISGELSARRSNRLISLRWCAGKIVAVKPNETWASREDCTAVTRPDSLRAVLRFIKRLEPRTLIVTGGAGAGETGLMEVAQSEGRNSSIKTARPSGR